MSPFAARVHCVLLHKAIPFEVQYVNPTRARRELPIGHTVPALLMGDDNINETADIIAAINNIDQTIPIYTGDAKTDEAIDGVVQWCDNVVIPHSFESVIPKFDRYYFGRVRRGWRLANVMANSAPRGLPRWLRLLWPWVLARQGFVQRLGAMADTKSNITERAAEINDEFIRLLGDGPYMLEQARPTLADLTVYASTAAGDKTGALKSPLINDARAHAWQMAMDEHLSAAPKLVPEGVLR